MKAIIKMTNGEEFTITGIAVKPLHSYFAEEGVKMQQPLGWFGDGNVNLNLNNAVSIKFAEE